MAFMYWSVALFGIANKAVRQPNKTGAIMSFNINKFTVRISFFYWILGGLYILFSDSLMVFLYRT